MQLTNDLPAEESSALETHWAGIMDRVRQEVGQQTYQAWFEPLRPTASDGGALGVVCPDDFFHDWFAQHHQDTLNAAGSAYFGRIVTFDLAVAKERPPTPAPSAAAAAAVEPVAPSRVESNLNPDYLFGSFVVGSGTDLACAAAQAIVKKPGSHFNPLFIHGGVGLGKTHLMQAIGNEILARAPHQRVRYVTAERFMNELIRSIQENRQASFRLKYRNIDVLLVDDVAFLAGKESTQEEFFHTFNALYDQKKQIVMTSDRSPKEIPTLEERLRSRFEWGLITDIQAPNLETRVAILNRKIAANGVSVPDDVVTLIAENITDNIRRLEGALLRLQAFASLRKQEITMDLALEALSRLFQSDSSGPPKIADIMSVVAEVHGFTVQQLKDQRKTADLARARQIAMYLARTMCDGASLDKIGRSFGGRDHSTVAHACKKIDKTMVTDPRFRGAVRDLQDRIRRRA